MKSNFLTVTALLLAAPVALAHDLWIEPSSFRPAIGERLQVALRVGQDLRGDPVPRIPPLLDQFILRDTSGASPIPGRPGADPAGAILIGAAGPQWIGYQSKASPVTLEGPKFEAYLKEEGLEHVIVQRRKFAQSAAPGRERFYRCAKAFLEVPSNGKPAGSTLFSTPLGFTLELTPRKNPSLLRAGEALPLLLTLRGKPVANVLVVAMRKDAPAKAVRARTDAGGRVSLRLDGAGFWLIKAVHMEAAGANAPADWESWWASLTFNLAGRARP